MESLDFKEGNFRDLKDFLGYFAGTDYERQLYSLSDEDIVKWYVAVSKPHERKKVLDQAKLILTLKPFPKAFVSRNSNLFFRTEDEARDWLSEMRSLIKSVRVEGQEARERAIHTVFPGLPLE